MTLLFCSLDYMLIFQESLFMSIRDNVNAVSPWNNTDKRHLRNSQFLRLLGAVDFRSAINKQYLNFGLE